MKVLVVGAGYAGTIAANRLARLRGDAEITVINPVPEFVERIRLHQRITGGVAAGRPLTAMLRPGIALRATSVEAIGDGAVRLTGGEELGFDRLVYAVGSTGAALPGTVSVADRDGAARARTALAGLADGATVTVVGGGLTGIETAAEIAERRPGLRVVQVAPRVGATLSDGAGARVRAGLRRLGVEPVAGEVTGTDDGGVRLASGAARPSDLTLWAIADAIPALAADSGLATDGRGRVIVDRYLRSTTDPRVLAVGDCAAVPGARASCQAAVPQGAYAAGVVAAAAAGTTPAPFSMGFTAQNVSLGRRDAMIQLSRRDDTVTRLHYAGRPAAVTKEQVCRAVVLSVRAGRTAYLPGPR